MHHESQDAETTAESKLLYIGGCAKCTDPGGQNDELPGGYMKGCALVYVERISKSSSLIKITRETFQAHHPRMKIAQDACSV